MAVNEVQGAYSSVNWRGIYQVDLGFGEIGLETQCSTTTANVGDTATEDELVVSEINEGDCWCKITDFTPKNGNKCSIASSRWVYEGTPPQDGFMKEPLLICVNTVIMTVFLVCNMSLRFTR